MNEQNVGWIDGCTDEHMDVYMDRQMKRWMDKSINGVKYECTTCMDGWVYG